MLKSDLTVCFIGGDKRQKYAAEKLSEYYKIKAAGECFVGTAKINCSESPVKAMYGARIIVLPLPAVKCEKVLGFSDIIEYAQKNQAVILGGMFSQYMLDTMEALGVRSFDYYRDECFTVRNAYITAEGALAIAMQELESDLRETDFAVLGYGRIGSALGDMIKANRGEATVYVRRDSALALAKERGLRAEFLEKLGERPHDVIFNTVPSRIISNEQILGFDTETLLIELASAPGGFDFEIAEQYGLKCINAQGLPGKYAPRSAGVAIAEALIKIIDKELML